MSEIKIKPVATWGPCCKIIRIGVWGPGTVHDGGCVNRNDGKLGPTHLLYTADALDAAREEGRQAGLEEAAQACEIVWDGRTALEYGTAYECSVAIRALKEKRDDQ